MFLYIFLYFLFYIFFVFLACLVFIFFFISYDLRKFHYGFYFFLFVVSVGNLSLVALKHQELFIFLKIKYEYIASVRYICIFQILKTLYDKLLYCWYVVLKLPVWVLLIFGVATVRDDSARGRDLTASKWSLCCTIQSTESSRSRLSSFS